MLHTLHTFFTQIKAAADAVSAVIALGTLLGLLPYISAGLAIIWYVIRIYEWWRGRRRGAVLPLDS